MFETTGMKWILYKDLELDKVFLRVIYLSSISKEMNQLAVQLPEIRIFKVQTNTLKDFHLGANSRHSRPKAGVSGVKGMRSEMQGNKSAMFWVENGEETNTSLYFYLFQIDIEMKRKKMILINYSFISSFCWCISY